MYVYCTAWMNSMFADKSLKNVQNESFLTDLRANKELVKGLEGLQETEKYWNLAPGFWNARDWVITIGVSNENKNTVKSHNYKSRNKE